MTSVTCLIDSLIKPPESKVNVFEEKRIHIKTKEEHPRDKISQYSFSTKKYPISTARLFLN